MPQRMNPEVKAKWVAALRSGEYQQGRGLLHYDDKWCCLGVLCDVAVKAGLPIQVGMQKPESSSIVSFSYDGLSDLLPDSVVKWAGLPGRNPMVAGKSGGCDVLSTLNDIVEYDFDRIADLIEEQL